MWDVLAYFTDGLPSFRFKFHAEFLKVADKFLLDLFPRLYNFPLRVVKPCNFVHLSPLDH